MSLANAMQVFMQWDEIVGCMAAIVWAGALVKNVVDSLWVLKMVGAAMVFGPTGAVVLAIWERDEEVLGTAIVREKSS